MSGARPVGDADYRLLWPGTLVVQPGTKERLPRFGVVEDYEHHRPGQKDFPVRFGDRWCLMTSLDVEERTDVPQPPGRRPPRQTASWTDEAAPEVPPPRASSRPRAPTAVTEITA